ncbi:extensin [Aplysia californica]|uniref:Extensin n=1 Tax=Aplysia californica TaxID=6500 RepID=A0ABM0JKN3_APLCA|nr:extensin [Aplysia californica]
MLDSMSNFCGWSRDPGLGLGACRPVVLEPLSPELTAHDVMARWTYPWDHAPPAALLSSRLAKYDLLAGALSKWDSHHVTSKYDLVSAGRRLTTTDTSSRLFALPAPPYPPLLSPYGRQPISVAGAAGGGPRSSLSSSSSSSLRVSVSPPVSPSPSPRRHSSVSPELRWPVRPHALPAATSRDSDLQTLLASTGVLTSVFPPPSYPLGPAPVVSCPGLVAKDRYTVSTVPRLSGAGLPSSHVDLYHQAHHHLRTAGLQFLDWRPVDSVFPLTTSLVDPRPPAPYPPAASGGGLDPRPPGYASQSGSGGGGGLDPRPPGYASQSGSGGGGAVVDLRASPGKQLPGRATRQERLQHRRQLVGVAGGGASGEAESEQGENHVKKSTSTQTQFSSFSHEELPPPPYYSTHDTIGQDRLLPGAALPLPPPPPLQQYLHDTGHAPGNPLPPLLHCPPPLPSPQSHPLPPGPHSHNLSLSSSSSSSLSLPSSSSSPPPPHSSSSAGAKYLHTSSSSFSSSSSISSLEPMSSRHTPPPPPPSSLPPYPTSAQRSSPPQYHELCQPLNLSLSHSSAPALDPPTSRPSLIATSCLSPPAGGPESPYNGAVHSEVAGGRTTLREGGPNHEMAAQVSDEAIEEHFRRSLGTCYSEVSPTKVGLTFDVPEKKCSVDDHFARALGDKMWTELKARSEPQSLDTLPGSVDAHFAKALGASTWKKLRAETQMIGLGPPPVQPQRAQQPPPVVQTSPASSSLHRPLAT